MTPESDRVANPHTYGWCESCFALWAWAIDNVSLNQPPGWRCKHCRLIHDFSHDECCSRWRIVRWLQKRGER